MEPAMARVLALSLIAPKLTESLGKISFWTSACTSSLQEKKKKKRGFLRNASKGPRVAPNNPCHEKARSHLCWPSLAQGSLTPRVPLSLIFGSI